MSIRETKRKETHEVEVTVKTEYFCDRCGVKIERGWFSRDSFRIKLTKGEVYPEGGSITTEQAYFCEPCSKDVKAALESVGVVFEIVEKDY